jgi:hypothetical protein
MLPRDARDGPADVSHRAFDKSRSFGHRLLTAPGRFTMVFARDAGHQITLSASLTVYEPGSFQDSKRRRRGDGGGDERKQRRDHQKSSARHNLTPGR